MNNNKDINQISSRLTKILLRLSRIYSIIRHISGKLHVLPRTLLFLTVIYIIVRQAITGDSAVDLLERSLIMNDASEWSWLILFIMGIVALSAVFIFVEKILVFNPIYNEYDDIDETVSKLEERIKGAEDQLIQTSVLTINNNKEETLNSNKFKLLNDLSISKTDVYQYEKDSCNTVILSKTLYNDTTDVQLHEIIINKLYKNPKKVKYVWFSDKQGLDDTVETLMGNWFKYMIDSPTYSLNDIWNSRNFNVEFRKIISTQHLLLHDINLYNYKSQTKTQAIGFLDEQSANEGKDNIVTHFIKLNIDNTSELIETLENDDNSKTVNLTWRQFIINQINKENQSNLWRIL